MGLDVRGSGIIAVGLGETSAVPGSTETPPKPRTLFRRLRRIMDPIYTGRDGVGFEPV
mgnify:CR=1 FL=1